MDLKLNLPNYQTAKKIASAISGQPTENRVVIVSP